MGVHQPLEGVGEVQDSLALLIHFCLHPAVKRNFSSVAASSGNTTQGPGLTHLRPAVASLGCSPLQSLDSRLVGPSCRAGGCGRDAEGRSSLAHFL